MKPLFLNYLFIFLVIFSGPLTKALEPTDVPHYGSYYSIDETPLLSLTGSQTNAVDVTRWVRHSGDPAQSPEPYDRQLDFGKWIRDPSSKTCYNTRAQVLVRDSLGPVAPAPENRCVIQTGRWLDPYSGNQIKSATEVQIDHLVPLKNAFISGAWQWSKLKRCAYANFMGNNFHLLSVGSTENMSKGDKGPEGYLPANKKYLCDYVSQWLKIKAIWNLTLNPPEIQMVQKVIASSKCSARNFILTKTELDLQRSKISELQNLCRLNEEMDNESTTEEAHPEGTEYPAAD